MNSGTKLNLDYYINEILDEDHQDEVFEYFREAETESVSDALEELGVQKIYHLNGGFNGWKNAGNTVEVPK